MTERVKLTRLKQIIPKNEAMWFPNAIYVEEPVYEQFLNVLRHAVQVHNDATGNPITSLDVVTEKEDQGFEIIKICHLFYSCFLIVNHNYTDISSSEIVDDNIVHYLVSVLPVRTILEAVSMANNDAGLAASLWSNDAVETVSLPFNLKYGTVWVNCASRYHPSVPIAPWWPLGYGTFSGKRMLFESLAPPDSDLEDTQSDCFYEGYRNVIFSKKDVSLVLKNARVTQGLWFKFELERRLDLLEEVAEIMENNWSKHFHAVLTKTCEAIWMKAIRYIRFWCSYVVDRLFEQVIPATGCRVLCVAEPLGTVGIFVGSASLDMLVFIISGALAYGNTVVVGVSDDEKCSITAVELELIFKLDAVSVVVGNSETLWKQFTQNEFVASVWWVKNTCRWTAYRPSFKHLVEVNADEDMTKFAEHFETYATKQKSLWLPCL